MPSATPLTLLRVPTRGPLVPPALMPGELVVVASFARSVYARSEAGHIVCLAGNELPMGPFSMVCDPWGALARLELQPGAVLRADGKGLLVSNSLYLDCQAAETWLPPVLAEFSTSACAAGLDRLRHLGRSLPAKEGLAALLPWVLGTSEGSAVAPNDPLSQALACAGMAGVDALDAWLSRLTATFFAAEQQALEDLVGLGPGLTPSGDDLLGGVLLALRLAGLDTKREALETVVLPCALVNTNRISYAYLQGAAQGYGSSVLHEALGAVAGDDPALPELCAGLDRMGHSSGWDAFLGALCVLRRVCL